MKKLLSIIMAFVMALTVVTFAYASTNSKEANELNKKFKDGIGPETDGIAIDYASYEPENVKDNTQYPLVILIHGMGQGEYKRKQLEDNNFSMFASDALQSRFTDGAAYIMVPRSDESDDNPGTWADNEIKPLYAAIQDYIAKNKDHIDITRIYIGGYSMGGKMTIKMISAYPDMFAAAFPMCPAFSPSEAQIKAVADMPIWMIVSRFDILAGYYVYGSDIWNMICENTNMPYDCLLSFMGTVCYPDGRKTTSNHHVWFAACNDMFSADGGDYPNTVTTDANGNTIELQYPNGLIKWMCQYSSDYDGAELSPNTFESEGNSQSMVSRMLKAIGLMLKDIITSAFSGIFKEIK